MKKEELIKENTKLKQSFVSITEDDQRKRKEFAKAFNWYEVESTYGYHKTNRSLRNPTWEEIFVKIGSLLTTTRESTNADYLQKQEERLRRIEQSLDNLSTKESD